MRLLVPMREREALLTYVWLSPEPASSGDSSVAEHGDRNDSTTPIAEVRDSQVIARSRRLTTLEMLRGPFASNQSSDTRPRDGPRRKRSFSVQKEKRSALVRAHASPNTAGSRLWRPQRSATAPAVVEFSGYNSSGRVAPPLKLAFAGRHDDLFIAFRMKPTTRMISLTRGHAPAGTRLGIGRTRPRYGAPPAARHKATQSRASFGGRRRSRALGRATSPLSRTTQTSP